MALSRRLTALVALSVALTAGAAEQADVAGSSDHPLLTRFPGCRIKGYKDSRFDAVGFRVNQGATDKKVDVEGRKVSIEYSGCPKESTPLEVLRNYTNAVRRAGGEVVFEKGNVATFRFTKGGREIWAAVDTGPIRDPARFYNLVVVEKAEMEQQVVVNAAAWASDLRATGKTALYGIHFDTGKAEVKQESAPTLSEIAKLLTDNPGLKVFVVGHTDMTGDPVSNVSLSEARAKAIVAALVSGRKVDPARLVPYGAGPYAPVASNKDEEGRAKNRRVELVDLAVK